jgi:hypothetical protein
MLSSLLRRHKDECPDLLNSKLFNEITFYPALLKDLNSCQNEVIIECPFITIKRIDTLLPAFNKLLQRGVSITMNTRDPEEHEDYLRIQATAAIATMQHMGINVLYTGSHHRKLVIIDRSILYEGSLNVLSQNDSCEIMRRMESKALARQLIDFLRISKLISNQEPF